MKYRTFGRLDWRVSALGFGAMRLPTLGSDPANVDEAESIRMLRYAIDHGVNYIDTAYPYHGGRSEIVVGKALKDGYREKVKVATKLPTWLVESPGDFDRYLGEQLRRLDMASVDFYLLHGLRKDRWKKLSGLGVLGWAEREIAAGRIRHLGFSFHDDLEAFKEIVDAYDGWTLAQIQYNYVDVDYQAGRRGSMYAAARGMAVVVMEPLRGGRLTRRPPERIARLWESAPQRRSTAEWCLRWVWDQPQVSTVLSGMSTMGQVVENISTAMVCEPGILTGDELALFGQVRQMYREAAPVPCTGCRYCMPCPNGVEIPRILELYNDAILYEDPEAARDLYRWVREEHGADRCTECGECQEACPQRIPVSDWLKQAGPLLAPRATREPAR